MSKSSDKEHGNRTFHRSEGKSRDEGGTSEKKVVGSNLHDSDKPYCQEKGTQVWKDKVLRRDRKLNDMAKHLEWLEALVDKKETEDARDSRRSEKRHSRREGSKEVDSGNSKKQRVTSSHQERHEREDLQCGMLSRKAKVATIWCTCLCHCLS